MARENDRVKRELIIQIAREFAQNAVDMNGRSMSIVGAGINHWFNNESFNSYFDI